MKKAVISIVSVMSVLMMIFCLNGCGNNDTKTTEQKLQEYIASEEFQGVISSVKTSVGEFADVDVYAKESNIDIDLKLKTQVDSGVADTVKSSIESALGQYKTAMDTSIEMIRKSVGVSDAGIEFILKNNDGSELARVAFGNDD